MNDYSHNFIADNKKLFDTILYLPYISTILSTIKENRKKIYFKILKNNENLIFL